MISSGDAGLDGLPCGSLFGADPTGDKSPCHQQSTWQRWANSRYGPRREETAFEEVTARTPISRTAFPPTRLPGSQGQLSGVNHAVESHQPLPAHQQLSSGFELRRKVRTLLESPRLNATDNFCAVSSSRAPKQGTNIAAQTNRASKWSVAVRVTRSMPPASGIPPGPSAGVRGNSRRPCNCRAFSQTFKGAVAPAFT